MNIGTNVLDFADVIGDGINDDYAGIQAALDSGVGTICLPKPAKCYLIGKTLKVHSEQTILADRYARIKLADQANCLMLANADQEAGNNGISVIGGVWDGNNANQTRDNLHADDYDPTRYIGVAVQFLNVIDLHISDLTIKDPESFAVQLGKVDRFTVEDITFDYNLLRLNMDGIHCNGLCSNGKISNLKGTTNDDLVALNADDGPAAEPTRGPIRDISIDNIYSDNGYTAVRLLSAGSPVSRVKISNVFGTYRYNVVSFTHHDVHPGAPTVFEDIAIDGVFVSKVWVGEPSADKPGSVVAPIRIASGALVKNVHISNYHRIETHVPVDDICVEPGATVEYMSISNSSLRNQTGKPVSLLSNEGTIDSLDISNVRESQ